MTNKEFKYWIHGFLTLTSANNLFDWQIKIIRNHANLVKTVEEIPDNDIEDFVAMLEEYIALNNYVKIDQVKKLSNKLIL